MATIKELAGGTGTQQKVSSATTQVSGAGRANYQVGEKLANDLLGIMGQASTTAQEFYTLSNKAAERVGSDRKQELSLYIEEVQKRTNPNDSKSLAKAQEDISLKQIELSKLSFDLDDAQLAFDDTYTKPTAVQVATINTTLKLAELNEKDKENFQALVAQRDTFNRAGILATPEENNDAINNGSAYGNFSKAQVGLALAKEDTTGFDERTISSIEFVLKNAGWNETSQWDLSMKKKVFEQNFGTWGYIDDNGAVKWHKEWHDDPKSEILKSWSRFDSGMSTNGVPDPFKEINNTTNTATSNSRVYVPSSIVKENIKAIEAKIQDIKTDKAFKPEHLRNATIQLNEYKREYEKLSVIDKDLKKPTSDTVVANMRFGRVIDIKDPVSKEVIQLRITPDDYQHAVTYNIEEESKSALAIDTSTPKGRQEFMSKVIRLKELEAISTNTYTSALTGKYQDITDGGRTSNISSLNEVNQLVAYNNVVIDSDKNQGILSFFNQEMDAILANVHLDDTAKLISAKSLIQKYKNNEMYTVASASLRKTISTKFNDWREGKGLTTLEARMATSAQTALAKKTYQVANIDNADSFVEGEMDKMIKMGSMIPLVTDKRQRIFIPEKNNVNSKTVGIAIEATIAEYNDIKKTHYDETDIDFGNDFKNGDYTITMRLKQGGASLGEITNQNVAKLNTRASEAAKKPKKPKKPRKARGWR